MYSAFDELSLAFDMPTDRAGLAPVAAVHPAALLDPAATGEGLRSGDRRWADLYTNPNPKPNPKPKPKPKPNPTPNPNRYP